MTHDDEAKKIYSEAGVDLPELKKDEPKEEPKAPPEAKPEVKSEPAKPEGASPEDKAPLQAPKEPRKRSIYDDYKDKKTELKSETERREQVELENAELRTKIEALNKAETPEEKKEAADDIEAFAKEIKADPAALRKMRDLFLKDVKPVTDPELASRLKSFEDWRVKNSQVIEQAAFEEEFLTSAPKLKELFPSASPEEMQAIKKELDAISHTKEWHDKSLAYVAFEHKEKLSALISPKKRGMESNDRKADAPADSFEFDPNADYATMNAKEREAWEAAYNKATKSEGLSEGANGKKILI